MNTEFHPRFYPRFELGPCLATEAALGALKDNHTFPIVYLRQHQSGDWGHVGRFAKQMNDAATPPIAPAASLDTLTESQFQREGTRIRAGIKWLNDTDGFQIPGECYQYGGENLDSLLGAARSFQANRSILSFALLTYTGAYRNMKTVWTWARYIVSAYDLADRKRIYVVTAGDFSRTTVMLSSQLRELNHTNYGEMSHAN